MLTISNKPSQQLRTRAADNVRSFLLVAVLAASTAKSVAFESDRAPPLPVLGDEPSFEWPLLEKSGAGGEYLSPDRPSMNGVDSAFPGPLAAPELTLAEEVQALIVWSSTEDWPMQETQLDLDRPADSRNLTVIYALNGEAAMDDPAHAVAPKSDLALTLGVKSNLSFTFNDANSIADDQAGKPLFNTFRFEAPGVAATVLFALWSLIAAVVLLVHFKQKAEQRRDLVILQSFSRMRFHSVTKPVRQEDQALQARLDTLPAYEWRMKSRTANSNADQDAVHAA